jgi:hypothetical protein
MGKMKWRVGIAIAMTTGVLACQSVAEQQAIRTPAPSAAVHRALHSVNLRIAFPLPDRDSILAYARSLTYADSATPAYHGQWDLNLLDTLGTMGLVEPEVHIHNTPLSDLAWENDSGGRVQLRITIAPSANHPNAVVELYSSGSPDTVHLYPGTTYVWVDSMVFDGNSGTARAVYVPVDTARPIERRLLHMLRSGGDRPGDQPPWSRAVARWTPSIVTTQNGGSMDPLEHCFECATSGWCH